MSDFDLIVTQAPYSTFMQEIAACDAVSGIRLNTVMPVKEGRLQETLAAIVERIAPKTLWIDLKARQLRIMEFANTPYTAVTLSHKISVELPAVAYFDNGNLTGKVVEIDGNKLILENYVGRMLGPGESVNIIAPSLKYLEPTLLTERDREYLEAGKALGIKHYLLSFVQDKADIEALRALYPGAVLMAKIEDEKSLKNLKAITAVSDYIMAGRGDLYVELEYPHQIGNALKYIKKTGGPKAVVASRMLGSLLKAAMPSCPDMIDLQFLKDTGYTHYLIGDDICFNRELLLKAINIFRALFGD